MFLVSLKEIGLTAIRCSQLCIPMILILLCSGFAHCCIAGIKCLSINPNA